MSVAQSTSAARTRPIVIGASAGGLGPLRTITGALPDLPADGRLTAGRFEQPAEAAEDQVRTIREAIAALHDAELDSSPESGEAAS
jgi:hypothetical protein